MNTKQLRYILVLVKAGSFSKAAEILNISQPSLSQYVKKIEQQVGVELFDRINGDVRLTNAGEVYVDTARKILDLERQLEKKILDVTSYKTGYITVGTSPYMAATMMPEIAKDFQKEYPGIHIVIREGTTNELIDAMEHGECDMCLTLLPVDEHVFDSEIIVREEVVLAVPVDYEAIEIDMISKRLYPSIDINELNGTKMIVLTDAQYMQRQVYDLIKGYKLEIGVAAVVKSLEAQIAMVRAGVGIAVVPSGVKRFCSEGEVRFYSFKQDLPQREIAIVWRRGCSLSKIATELLNIIKRIAW